MKKLKILTGAIAILFLAVSCESVGLFGFGGVKGDKAKEEILAVATQANVIQCAAFGGSVDTGTCVVFGIIIDGVVVPGLAGIKDSEHYSRPSVNDCKKKILSVGLLASTWIGAITCDLKETPMLLQLGDGDTGSVLQLGPLGL